MNRNIEEENQMFTIIKSSFLSPILIDGYCTLSANEIACFENQLNSSVVPVWYLTQPALGTRYMSKYLQHQPTSAGVCYETI